MIEIHEILLANDGLLEDEATNQGAWLTESAGAVRDLHASILTSLLESEHASIHAAGDSRKETPSGEYLRQIHRIADSTHFDSLKRLHGDNPQIGSKVVRATKDSGVGHAPVEVENGSIVVPNDVSDAERTRLWELGRLLACKRQWAASRQAFDDAMRGCSTELHWRERNKAYYPGFFLDMPLRGPTFNVRLELKSRWQSGVETDKVRLCTLDDFARFTGVHQGADTLITTPPSTGWSDGSADLAYAERLSRSRTMIGPLRARAGANKATSALTANEEESISGIMLGHAVPAEDVSHP